MLSSCAVVVPLAGEDRRVSPATRLLSDTVRDRVVGNREAAARLRIRVSLVTVNEPVQARE
jgi:hypothetical protein